VLVRIGCLPEVDGINHDPDVFQRCEMKRTYKAMQVSKPGLLELVERDIPTPGPGQVLIGIEACGVCGADAVTIKAASPSFVLPRVPGHEVAGRIIEVGPGVHHWRVGQRVGVGRFGGHCGECRQCRKGEFVLCENQGVVGLTEDGGFAEMMLAKTTGLVAIPDELNSVEAAPLLCAGLATFNALKKSGAQAGDLVAIQGIGGLGHLAVQYARKMGFRVVAISRGTHRQSEIESLGAHHYIDSEKQNPAKVLTAMGGAQLIFVTSDSSEAASSLLSGLARQGKLLLAGAGSDPLSIPPGKLVIGKRTVEGALTGSPIESEATLDFSVLADVRPKIETMPLEQAAQAYERMASGQARFRMVLTMQPTTRG
jgi:alcohol dehydrogenase